LADTARRCVCIRRHRLATELDTSLPCDHYSLSIPLFRVCFSEPTIEELAIDDDLPLLERIEKYFIALARPLHSPCSACCSSSVPFSHPWTPSLFYTLPFSLLFSCRYITSDIVLHRLYLVKDFADFARQLGFTDATQHMVWRLPYIVPSIAPPLSSLLRSATIS
jgi:hypothetical protein